jgi:hypothetical protein
MPDLYRGQAAAIWNLNSREFQREPFQDRQVGVVDAGAFDATYGQAHCGRIWLTV